MAQTPTETDRDALPLSALWDAWNNHPEPDGEGLPTAGAAMDRVRTVAIQAIAQARRDAYEKAAVVCDLEASLGGEKQNNLSGAKLAAMIRNMKEQA